MAKPKWDARLIAHEADISLDKQDSTRGKMKRAGTKTGIADANMHDSEEADSTFTAVLSGEGNGTHEIQPETL